MREVQERELAWVAQKVNLLVESTMELLVHCMESPDQLVLNITREQVLEELQELLQLEISSPDASMARAWRLANAIVAICITYVFETSNDSITYQPCRARPWKALIMPMASLTFHFSFRAE